MTALKSAIDPRAEEFRRDADEKRPPLHAAPVGARDPLDLRRREVAVG